MCIRDSPHTNMPARERVPFTPEESQAIRDGVAKHGTGRWEVIRTDPEFAPTLARRSGVDIKDRHRTMQRKGSQARVVGWPLQTELQEFRQGLSWCCTGLQLAWSSPEVGKVQRRRLIPVSLVYGIAMITALAVGMQLRLWLWVYGALISGEQQERSWLHSGALLCNSFCVMSLVTLFVLRMALDGDGCFFAVLAPLHAEWSAGLVDTRPCSLQHRLWLASTTTGPKLLTVGLCGLAWSYPGLGVLIIPVVFLLQVNTCAAVCAVVLLCAVVTALCRGASWPSGLLATQGPRCCSQESPA
eukprot:TRINITY_DN6890_c0_g1_i2.p1 TRINITY_DN6890_c0_g1~~TRINITY_DN6890_c0_g1_i2.p1  ORF type:complete len:300 (+),score=60.00 TRINITY_DN6890_c0_g1_i2:121-1020(+)